VLHDWLEQAHTVPVTLWSRYIITPTTNLFQTAFSVVLKLGDHGHRVLLTSILAIILWGFLKDRVYGNREEMKLETTIVTVNIYKNSH